MTRPSVLSNRRIVLFIFGMLLCTSQLEGQEQKGLLTVKRIYSQPSLGGRLNRGVQWAPDGKFVSFVRAHNLFLVSVADAKERALTTGGTEAVRKGELDWVYPEELDLKTAYWWSPDSSKIAFLEMDESKVSKYPLVDFASYDGDAEEERYPVAGGNNPVVHVFAVSIDGGNATWIDTGAETNQYIPRVDWLRDSKRL